MRVRLPGWLVSCWINGGSHSNTSATNQATAHTQVVGLHAGRPTSGTPTDLRLRARSATAVSATVTSVAASTTTTSTSVEILVWTMNEPISTAPSRESGDRSMAAAHSSTNRSKGKITTIGFQGLTSPPRAPSE